MADKGVVNGVCINSMQCEYELIEVRMKGGKRCMKCVHILVIVIDLPLFLSVTRVEQAELFNCDNSCNVMVATDAVGMGLNL